MLSDITLSDLEGIVVFLVGLIAGLVTLYSYIKKFITVSIKPELEKIRSEQEQADINLNQKIDGLDERVTRVDMQQTKNYLVRCLNDIDKGAISDSELERFWEQYKHYDQQLNLNGYIKSKVEKFQKEGKL